jgi:hypothetical protein
MTGTKVCLENAILSFSVNVIDSLLTSNPLCFRAKTDLQAKGEKALCLSFFEVQSSLESSRRRYRLVRRHEMDPDNLLDRDGLQIGHFREQK